MRGRIGLDIIKVAGGDENQMVDDGSGVYSLGAEHLRAAEELNPGPSNK